MSLPEQAKRVIAVLPFEEASALVDLGAALEPFIERGSPADRATAKLDEQTAAQMRDPYKEAEDELRDRLGYVLHDHEYHAVDWDVLARAVVDRVLGVYE